MAGTMDRLTDPSHPSSDLWESLTKNLIARLTAIGYAVHLTCDNTGYHATVAHTDMPSRTGVGDDIVPTRAIEKAYEHQRISL